MLKCYEMHKGQRMVCQKCGFELTVVNDCNTTCKTEGCCETNEFKCCGEYMKVID